MTSRAQRAAMAAAAVELAAIRAQLIERVRGVDATITNEQAQGLLERALAWSPNGARRLAAHLTEHPRAFTAPSSHCPTSLPRLLRLHQPDPGPADRAGPLLQLVPQERAAPLRSLR